MRRILLVTAREYQRMIRVPAFWVVALIIPVIVFAAPVLRGLLRKSQTVGYVLVDKSGHYADAVNRRVDLDYQREVLVQLLVYAKQWRAPGRSMEKKAAAAAAPRAVSSDTAVQNFVAAGGAPGVLKLLGPRLVPNAPEFEAPQRPFVAMPVPAGVDTSDPDRFGASIGPRFGETSSTTGQAALGVAIYIPKSVDVGGEVRVWMNGAPAAALVQDLRLELTRGLEQDALRAAKVDPLTAAQVQAASAAIAIESAKATAAGEEAIVRSALPLVLADLLLVSMVISGAMMLQGLVEERSDKLLEAVLACVSPRELMLGKLLGISAIGLSVIGVWIAATVGIISAEPAHPFGFLLGALGSFGTTPWLGAAMIFYFLAGFLTIGMIFLTVGAISDSMQEAQAYLMPLALILVAPVMALASIIHRDPNGLLPQIASWIPLYTPVIMLARLQSGVTRLQIFGTGAVLLAFGALELVVLGRLFESALIRTGGGLRLRLPRSGQSRRLARYALLIIAIALAIGFRIDRRLHRGRHPAAALSARGEAVAGYLTGRRPSAQLVASADPPRCAQPPPFNPQDPGWNGWSVDPRNSRFQPNPGLTAADAPRLQVKWAMSDPGGEYGQPTAFAGRLFLTSVSGAVYSLDARTGCMLWRFAQPASSRTTVSVGPLPGIARSGFAAYFGDLNANVYAVDAGTGVLLWKTTVATHPLALLTGSPTLFEGRLYVPVSSGEETVSASARYRCCTFRGSVVALNAATGRQVWKTYAIPQTPAPAGENSAGTQMYGPAGAAVWSAPTIDVKRNRLYFTTGDSYTDVQEDGSDAIIAVDLATGRVLWRHQVTRGDNFLSGCNTRRLPNCPKKVGRDFDFGSSPILVSLPGGKDILLAGQKSGSVFGLDPDTGRIVWRTQVGVGGFLGGIEWGMSSDGERLYVANADALVAGRPGLFALAPATGRDIWFAPAPHVGCSWKAVTLCLNAQSAAPTATPGVVYAGTTDGHERAYAAADGRILWDFDTARATYRTINGVSDQSGGAIDVSSGVVADGMLFVISGYRSTIGGGSANVLLAFSVDGH
ncbi:MAG: PQQ-binding-like beta-propeller repeat protein [Steroidobacteraceae bacterium]